MEIEKKKGGYTKEKIIATVFGFWLRCCWYYLFDNRYKGDCIAISGDNYVKKKWHLKRFKNRKNYRPFLPNFYASGWGALKHVQGIQPNVPTHTTFLQIKFQAIFEARNHIHYFFCWLAAWRWPYEGSPWLILRLHISL